MTDFLSTIDEFLASFTAEEHAVTRVVFRSLLKGRGLRPEDVAATLGTSLTSIERTVDALIERGTMERDADSGELVAARGLSLAETAHRLTLDGRQLYAFCAVDAVGIPAALRIDARVESLCHVCGARVTLALSGGTVTDGSPGAVIWAAERDPTRSLRRYT
jgi:alkylmercury lyase